MYNIINSILLLLNYIILYQKYNIYYTCHVHVLYTYMAGIYMGTRTHIKIIFFFYNIIIYSLLEKCDVCRARYTCSFVYHIKCTSS